MLVNYITLREYELEELKENEIKTEERSSYNAHTGKLFRNMLFFLKEARMFKNRTLLLPSSEQVNKLRVQFIPKLIKIVCTEAMYMSDYTLDDLL